MEAPHSSLHFQPSSADFAPQEWPWQYGDFYGAVLDGLQHQGAFPAAAAPTTAAVGAGYGAVFHTTSCLTMDSDSPPKSSVRDLFCSPSASMHRGHPQPQQQPQQQQPPASAAHQAQLEQANAELLRRCQELQDRLDAAAAAAAEASAASPPRAATASPQQFAGDSEAEQLLQRRLAAKQREADAAGQAVAAAQQQAAQREAELAEERARATGLADEVARWRDEFTLKEREVKSLQQRLEAATSHGGLLGDSLAALKKRSGELGTALAQRDVTVRQLEDELRALQAQHAQQAARNGSGRGSSSQSSSRERQLEQEVQRLQAALQQAREQAGALHCRIRELEEEAAAATAAALAAQQGERAALAEARQAGMRERQQHLMSRQPAAHEQPSAAMQQQQQPQNRHVEPAELSSAGPWLNRRSPAPVQDYHQLDRGPQGSQQLLLRGMPQLQQAPYACWEPQEQQGQPAAPLAAASRRGAALQQYNQPASWTPPSGLQARVAAGAADRPGSDACSVSSHAMAPAPPACSPLPLPWQLRGGMMPGQQQGSGDGSGGHGGGSSQGDAVASHLGALGLHTPSSASSPFGTEATLQDMLARTQALEDLLLQLHAEKNELEAESARMPSHTTGRTMQERKRRGEVEARLEKVNRECSSVRLQLRRLGVK